MAGTSIEFPVSTAPSRNPSENGGRLINAYAEKAPDGSRSKFIIRRAPGLTALTDIGDAGEFRGTLTIGGVLYVVRGNTAYTVTGAPGAFTVTALTGAVSGEGPVIMARNLRAPTPQMLGVTSAGMVEITGSGVSDFSDPDVPSPNSICFMDGFFFVTVADGRVFASGINDTGFSELDFASAEASVDGLKRAIPFNSQLLLMGDASTEFWSNTGNPTGFPFSRETSVSVGLLSRYAVAGFEMGFTAPLFWVGNDHVVYRMVGYQPARVSTPALERLIEAADPDDLEAHVYVAAGHPCWVLSSATWTWVYDTSTETWHERQSIGSNRWRARFGVNAFDRWVTFDRAGSAMFAVDDQAFREGTDPLAFEVRSKQMHRFPGRIAVNRASFDFVTGVGRDRGIPPIETNPSVSLSWSDDGGVSFGNALLRSLGTQGEQTIIDVWRCGLTGRNGRQWRLQVSDPVEVSLLGGAVEAEARSA